MGKEGRREKREPAKADRRGLERRAEGCPSILDLFRKIQADAECHPETLDGHRDTRE